MLTSGLRLLIDNAYKDGQIISTFYVIQKSFLYWWSYLGSTDRAIAVELQYQVAYYKKPDSFQMLTLAPCFGFVKPFQGKQSSHPNWLLD